MASMAGVLTEVMAALQSLAAHTVTRVLSTSAAFVAAPVPSTSEFLVAYTAAFKTFLLIY